MIYAAVRLGFPSRAPDPLPPFGELTAAQQLVLRALADLGPATWCSDRFISIMQAWRLPSAHAECRIYAGLDTP
jgi:hypothetical protein